MKLVLIGARDKGEDTLAKEIRRLGLEEDVVLLGWIPFEDVPSIYQGCEAFVFPTLHEGFGLPVIGSHIEPLIEVAGDAALFVDSLDSEAIGKAIVSLLNDPSARAVLVQKGYQRAREFTWEATARKTLSFIESVAGGAAASARGPQTPS